MSKFSNPYQLFFSIVLAVIWVLQCTQNPPWRIDYGLDGLLNSDGYSKRSKIPIVRSTVNSCRKSQEYTSPSVLQLDSPFVSGTWNGFISQHDMSRSFFCHRCTKLIVSLGWCCGNCCCDWTRHLDLIQWGDYQGGGQKRGRGIRWRWRYSMDRALPPRGCNNCHSSQCHS